MALLTLSDPILGLLIPKFVRFPGYELPVLVFSLWVQTFLGDGNRICNLKSVSRHLSIANQPLRGWILARMCGVMIGYNITIQRRVAPMPSASPNQDDGAPGPARSGTGDAVSLKLQTPTTIEPSKNPIAQRIRTHQALPSPPFIAPQPNFK